ncbi:MAG: L-threonylcarbamoyladenylate synthase [Candidatus Dormibacteria bacterium]
MQIEEIALVIERGGVVGIPTDTVYGLACDPLSSDALERVYAIKHRPAGLELTLLAATRDDVEQAVMFNAAARRLADRYWPGAVSIVASLRGRRYAIPRSGDTLSVRIPDHPLLADLLRRTGPLATTSANRHGGEPGRTADDVRRALGHEVDAVLDGGPAGGRASSIIDCSRMPVRVLREGPIGERELLAAARVPTSPSQREEQ